MYKWLLFDADDTLLDFKLGERRAITATFESVGLPTDDVVIETYSRINDNLWKMLERGETTREHLKVARFAEFFSAVGYDGDPAVMADSYVQALSRQAQLMDGAMELITALHGRCRMYIITNGITSVQKSRFGGCPLSPYFDHCFISEEMGCAKPEKKFFDQVAAAIPNFDPKEAIVIGDSLSSDMQGGIHAGLHTCWFNPDGKIAPFGMDITYTVSQLLEIKNIILGTDN